MKKSQYHKSNTFTVLNESKYFNPQPSASALKEAILSELKEFVGDCDDITYFDYLSVAIDKSEIWHLFEQVFSNQHDDLDLEMWIEKCTCNSFSDLITIYLRKPRVTLDA
jgi:hypothetical protein